jgi:S-disulfanyl-L-cysteine oxidoreductase SoxD
MFSSRDLRVLSHLMLALALLTLVTLVGAAPATPYTGIGRAATPAELAAWDIDVRPDFKGLPPGRGSVAKGQEVWEAKCSSCHGIFGESNEVFTPMVGGTTERDITSGRVARLTDGAYPGRTTMMKLGHLSTLWDTINRAMPWNAPKSLSVEEVYAVTAYVLNLAGVLPNDFVLGHDNIAQVQQRLPNRHGFTTEHALWPGRSAGVPVDPLATSLTPRRPAKPSVPDVRATACMKACTTEATVASFLPEHARDAHGNLADQNRSVGAQRGANTAKSNAPTAPAATAGPAAASPAMQALAQKSQCLTCHGLDRKVLGPALRDVAKKYAGQADATALLLRKIVEGGSGVWGPVPMPAQTIPAADAQALAAWLAAGAR